MNCTATAAGVTPASSSAAHGGPVVAEVCDPVGVLAHRQLQLLAHVVEERREEVDVLREDAGVLHPQDPGALQVPALDVEMELTAALGLALVSPVDCAAAL